MKKPINPFIFFNKGEKWKVCSSEGIAPASYLISDQGNAFSLVSGRYLNPSPSKSTGYKYITDYASLKHKSIHRLVASEFVEGKTKERNDVNHKNGDKTKNFSTNLEWVTRAENNQHAYRTGLNNYIGENCHSAKLTNENVNTICKLLEEGYEIYPILDIMQMERSMNNYEIIRSIRKGYAWKNISCNYNIQETNFRFRSISKDQIMEVCKSFQDGLSIPETYEKVFNEKYNGSIENRSRYTQLLHIYNRSIFKEISKDYNF